MKARDKFGKKYLYGALILEVITFSSMILDCKSITQMFYFLAAGMCFIIPCFKEIREEYRYNASRYSNKNINTTNKDVKQEDKCVTELKDYKEKKTTNNINKNKKVLTKGYEEFNNLLISSMKGGLMNRECVLKLKHEVRHLLGTHVEVYIGANSKFKFNSDMHEIYVLSKSSHLKEEDYTYLINFLGSNLDLSSAEEVTEN